MLDNKAELTDNVHYILVARFLFSKFHELIIIHINFPFLSGRLPDLAGLDLSQRDLPEISSFCHEKNFTRKLCII